MKAYHERGNALVLPFSTEIMKACHETVQGGMN